MTDSSKAILLSLLGFFLYSVGDSLRKIVLIDHSPQEVQLWCIVFSLLSILFLSGKLGGVRSVKSITRPYVHLFRAVLQTVAMTCFVFALARLSMDVFYPLVFITPIVTAILALMFFGEKLTARKLFLILFGFSGVLLIARPDSDIDMIGAVIALCGAVAFSISLLVSKLFSNGRCQYSCRIFVKKI